MIINSKNYKSGAADYANLINLKLVAIMNRNRALLCIILICKLQPSSPCIFQMSDVSKAM